MRGFTELVFVSSKKREMPTLPLFGVEKALQSMKHKAYNCKLKGNGYI